MVSRILLLVLLYIPLVLYFWFKPASSVSEPSVVPSSSPYASKTPYEPRQGLESYEKPPAGFDAIFTQLVARHGSRGLTSFKFDLAMYNIVQKAAELNALTPLGVQFSTDLMVMMRANALMGYGTVKKPGYGNLSGLGAVEHQQLAQRMVQRLPQLFAGIVATSRKIMFMSSGVDRAEDSGLMFLSGLQGALPALEVRVEKSPALTSYPAQGPKEQKAGVNRFLLYFHKLIHKKDAVQDSHDPYFSIFQRSLQYQEYLDSENLHQVLRQVNDDMATIMAGRVVLERLFTKDFVNLLASGAFDFANRGTFTFTSDDGQFTTAVSGNGKYKVRTLQEAAMCLYNIFAIAPAMKMELSPDFSGYFPQKQAQQFAYVTGAGDFYSKGPGIREDQPVTYQIAAGLLADFFGEVDGIRKGNLSHGAVLRFAHAEVMIPFVTALQMPDSFVPVASQERYTYEHNPWRGSLVSPLAGNIQWDVFRNGEGVVLVRMLHNEKEAFSKASCDSAKIASNSHFYHFERLQSCYQENLLGRF